MPGQVITIRPGNAWPSFIDKLIGMVQLGLRMTVKEDVTLVLATEDDAEALLRIQRSAFLDEARGLHRSVDCGPKGYDRLDGQIALLRNTDLFKILCHGHTVGGVAVADSGGRCRVVRLFVDPSHQRMGIGHAVFPLLYQLYPNALQWTLDTPSWSVCNHRFYESLGFRKVGETDDEGRGFSLFLYERRIPSYRYPPAGGSSGPV